MLTKQNAKNFVSYFFENLCYYYKFLIKFERSIVNNQFYNVEEGLSISYFRNQMYLNRRKSRIYHQDYVKS